MVTEAEHTELGALAKSGEILIGVHTSGAANFYDKDRNEMEEAMGLIWGHHTSFN